ncbi:MAG: hypothetical protein KGI75_10600 [Rhizobiaceae bacterium]|nr:hypothetical protein [Rhizobiaceae bacterium]
MTDNHLDTGAKGVVASIAEEAIDIGLAALDAVKDGMVVAIADLNAEWMTEAEVSVEETGDKAASGTDKAEGV